MIFLHRREMPSAGGGDTESNPREGTTNAWKKVFGEYLAGQGELPNLESRSDFDSFMSMRPEFRRAMEDLVATMRMSWGDIFSVGAEVLKEQRDNMAQNSEEKEM